MTYIPPLVANIVKANEKLSNYGIGPISDKSLPFYAGRWVDPITNKIRLLPPASQRFINPLSRNQKLGYLQATILNKWNKFVEIQSQYMNLLKVSDQTYKSKALSAI